LLYRNVAETQQIIVAFMKRYIEEEVKDIGGQSQQGKHFIVTNFVAYSGLVSAIVHKACKICPSDSEVICFTTLTMPISKWFNFFEIKNKAFPYCRIHEGWERYTKDLRKLITKKEIRIVLQRCVLSVSEEFAETHKSDQDFAFKSETEMEEHCKHLILVPTHQSKQQFKDLAPIKGSDIGNWLSGVLSDLKSQLEFYPTDENQAYVILPNKDSLPETLPSPEGYGWCPLGYAFMYLFHSLPQTENARCKTLTSYEWQQFFSDHEYPQKMPEDLFFVGFRKRNNKDDKKWLFCLAADVNHKLDKITLEFISETLNKERFDAIVTYMKWLSTNSKELQTWLA